MLAGMPTACTQEQDTADTPKSAVKQEQTSTVADENYALAETQIIIAGYIKKIAAATKQGLEHENKTLIHNGRGRVDGG